MRLRGTRYAHLPPSLAALLAAATFVACAAIVRGEPPAEPDVPRDSSMVAISSSEPELSAHWALVLSGGVARGFGHVGAIRALEEEGLRPDLVVGSSMGGLIGALYASGYSSHEIQAIARDIDWSGIFGPRTDAYGWRSPPRPRVWIKLVGFRSGLRFPSGLVDDSQLNFTLSKIFLDSDAACAGDFDRLPIRFRTVATDLATARSVLLTRGSVARAVRATVGMPLLFTPMSDGEHLLLDGGMSANMPLDAARTSGADRLLAVDVGLPAPKLDEKASGIAVALQLFDLLNKRGQLDTLTKRDTYVWLKLPGISAMDFTATDTIIERSVREARGPIHRFAVASGLPRVKTPLPWSVPVMPRLARSIEWRGGSVARGRAARAVMRNLPEVPFRPHELVPALDRLQRSGLFESQWPTLEVHGDSTVLALDVREQPGKELGLAAAAGTDEGARMLAGLAFRPVAGPLPALVRVDGILRHFGWAVNVSGEPYALDRGNRGWFVRGTQRQTRTRVFEDGERVGVITTNRTEAMLGAQVGLFRRQIFQLGAGWGQVDGSGDAWRGALVAFRTEGQGSAHRLIEADWTPGSGGYSRVNAWFDFGLEFGGFVVRPGARAGGASDRTPTDALVGLGGPPTLIGLSLDEWLGHRMLAAELRVAREIANVFSLYVTGQVGVATDLVSGADLGTRPRSAFGAGAELATPFGPFRLDWGQAQGGRQRLDLMLGERF
jgi:predicted acylesterase/phospholipase RssA